jgi:hypothetical protein
VVPDRRAWHPGLEGDFALIEAPQAVTGNGSSARRAPASLASIVFVGNRRTVLMLHEDDDVAAYKRAIGRITVELRDTLDAVRDSKNAAEPALRGNVRAVRAGRFDR